MHLDDEGLTHKPDGSVNAPFLLSQANLLLKAGEVVLAANLFRLIKTHPSLGYCGYYGLGLCYLAQKKYSFALGAFERAYSLARKHFIGVAIVEAMIECERKDLAQKRALEFATEYKNDATLVESFKNLYVKALN